MESTITILQSLQVVDFDAGIVFSGTPSGKMVKGYAAPSLFTPAVDPNYIFHEHPVGSHRPGDRWASRAAV